MTGNAALRDTLSASLCKAFHLLCWSTQTSDRLALSFILDLTLWALSFCVATVTDWDEQREGRGNPTLQRLLWQPSTEQRNMQTDGSAPKAAFHLSFTKFLSCSKFIAPVPLAINLGPVAYLMSRVLPENLANGRIDAPVRNAHSKGCSRALQDFWEP